MITHDHLYIGGEWRPPHGTERIDVVSPSTEEIVASVAIADASDVDRAVRAAREAFDHGPWPRLTASARADHLRRLGQELSGRAEELAQLIAAENGSPIAFSRAGQVAGPLFLLSAYADLVERFELRSERVGAAHRGVVVMEPVGVVAAIAPWNGPLYLTMSKLAPALAVGCTIVIKPAPESPLDAHVLAEACDAIGLPPGVVNVVQGGVETGRQLVGHAGVDKVAFTGSTAAGRWIMAACAQTLKRVTMELGGKSPAILLDDVDVASVVAAVAPRTMLHTGQACVLLSRVLTPRALHDDVVEALSAAIAAMRMGDPFDEASVLGPLISARQRDRVEGYIASGSAEGAKVALGGGRPADLAKGWYVEPTVFAGVDNSMRIAQEEIFGPVVSVIPFDDLDEAIRLANDTVYGLGGAVYGTDVDAAFSVAERIRSGVVGVNKFSVDPMLPFGGFKQSGFGREGGNDGLSEYVEAKTILLP